MLKRMLCVVGLSFVATQIQAQVVVEGVEVVVGHPYKPFNHAEAIHAMTARGAGACTACHQAGAEFDAQYAAFVASDVVGVANVGRLRLGPYLVSALNSPLFRSHLPVDDEPALLVVSSEKKAESDANLQAGDVIIEISGASVGDMREVQKVIELKRDEELEVAIVRAGKKRVAKIAGSALAEPPQPYRIGVQVESPSAALRAQLQLYKEEGLLVVGVVDDSAAAKAGIQTHDVLLRANGERLSSFSGLERVVNQSEGKPMTLTLMRAGSESEIEVTPVRQPKAKPVSAVNCPAWQLEVETKVVEGVPLPL